MKPIIAETATIADALRLINDIVSDQQILLVIDADSRVVGTLSDGDVRRGLLAGHALTDPVGQVCHRNFRFIYADEYSVERLRQLRAGRFHVIPILDRSHRLVDVVNLDHTRSCLPIDAVLMAGGKGERLRPLTESTPKPLLPVGGKCIIDHNVDRLISYGVKRISVTVNYLAEQITAHFASPRQGVKVDTVTEPRFLGTIGSLKLIDHFHHDVILVMNSDLFTNIDYEDFYLHFIDNNADMSVAAIPYNVSIPYGILELDGQRVSGLLEKPCYTYYANAGIYLLRREALSAIPDGEFFNATDLIERLISQGSNVVRYPLNGTWIDIGTPQEYQKAIDLSGHLPA